MIFTDFKKRLLTALALLFLLFIIFVNDIALLYTILVFGTLSIIEFFNLNQKITKNKFIKLIFNTAFIMFVFLFCTTFFLFSNFIQLKIIFFIILIGCIASDLGGYIIGKIFKGPKLTSISPNKTISGAFGSIIFSIIIINVLIFYYVEIINIKTIFIGVSSLNSSFVGSLVLPPAFLFAASFRISFLSHLFASEVNLYFFRI